MTVAPGERSLSVTAVVRGLMTATGRSRSPPWSRNCCRLLSGVTKIKDRVPAGRALAYASATGRAKAATTRGRSEIRAAVGYRMGDGPQITRPRQKEKRTKQGRH